VTDASTEAADIEEKSKPMKLEEDSLEVIGAGVEDELLPTATEASNSVAI
jgi:hypothetical protein